MSNQLSISRRKVLAGLGMIGIASAGAGLGTTAYFRDEESVAAELQAGRLDILLDYRATYGTWLDQEGTDAIVNGTAIEDPTDGAMQNYVVGQAPDWRNVDGSMVSGPAWASITNDVDACVYEDTTDIRSEVEAAGGDYVVDGTVGVDDGFFPGYVDGDEGVMFDLNDVKPKDEGEATISVHLCDNPAFLGLTAEVIEAAENEAIEPEDVGEFVDSDDSESELPYYIYVRAWLDDDCSNTYEAEEETLVYEGSLAGLVAAIGESDADENPVEGLQVGGECLDPGVHCVAFDWYFVCEPEDFELSSDAAPAESDGTLGDELDAAGLPRDPNAAQTDTASFRLGFNAVQCRHNMEMCETVVRDGFGKPAEFESGTDSLYCRARYGNNGSSGAYELAVGEAPVDGVNETTGNYVWTSGETVDWSFSYDGSGSTFVFDGIELNDDSTPTLADEVVVQTKAQEGSSISVTIDEILDADGNPVSLSGPMSVSATGTAEGRDLKYLLVPDCAAFGDLNDGFSFSGTATVTIDEGASISDEGVAFDVNVE
jgi:predicted ribosomally synthesized peptide with SipW-like signal peptide